EGEAESARTEFAAEFTVDVLLVDDVVESRRAQCIAGPNRQAGPIIEEFLAQSEIRPRKRAHTALLRLHRSTVAEGGLQVQIAQAERISEIIRDVRTPAPPERIVLKRSVDVRAVRYHPEALHAHVAAQPRKKRPGIQGGDQLDAGGARRVEIVGTPDGHAVLPQLLIESNDVRRAPVEWRERDRSPWRELDVAQLEGVDVLRLQRRVARSDVERIVVARERIQEKRPRPHDPPAVARAKRGALRRRVGQECTRE